MRTDKITQGNCFEHLRRMADRSVDLTLTDPPYGKRASKGTHGFGRVRNRKYTSDWDHAIPDKKVFDEILRVSKNVIIFGGNYFAHLLPPSSCWLVWDKKGEVKFHNPFADCELIYTSFSKPVKKYTFRQQGFVSDSADERYHPTQKPSELVGRLIRDWSNESDLIFDPFLGSGTTAVAAKMLGRHYLGIEQSEEYVAIARARLRTARCAMSVRD